MHTCKRSLVFFTIFIGYINAELTINYFDAAIDDGSGGIISTVFSTYIELWANVTDCPQTDCSCEVSAEDIGDDSKLLNFDTGKTNIGKVVINDLEPNTNYTFTLTCQNEETLKHAVTVIETDIGRPSAPQQVTASIIAAHLVVIWKPPLNTFGPVSIYRITKDNDEINKNRTTTNDIYKFPEEYEAGTTHKITVVACNKNRQGDLLCSNLKNSTISFPPEASPTPATQVPPRTTTTTTRSIPTRTPVVTTATVNTTPALNTTVTTRSTTTTIATTTQNTAIKLQSYLTTLPSFLIILGVIFCYN